jgi:transcriptional regulator of acetoin/glycerol metabolism
MMTMGDMIDVQDLPPYLHSHSEHSARASALPIPDIGTFQEQERSLLIRALEAAAGNQSKAARLLRIGRDALRYKLKKHNLETPDSERASAAAG